MPEHMPEEVAGTLLVVFWMEVQLNMMLLPSSTCTQTVFITSQQEHHRYGDSPTFLETTIIRVSSVLSCSAMAKWLIEHVVWVYTAWWKSLQFTCWQITGAAVTEKMAL